MDYMIISLVAVLVSVFVGIGIGYKLTTNAFKLGVRASFQSRQGTGDLLDNNDYAEFGNDKE